VIHSKLEDVEPDALEEFWAEVEKIGWSKTTSVKKAKRLLLKTWTLEKSKRMRAAFDELRDPLYDACASVEGVGDDSFGDLLAHIIGLGKAEYERVLANPKLAQARVDAGDFVESFSYCLPYEEDYKTLDPRYYVKWAQDICKDLKEGFGDDRFEPVFPQMQKLIDLFIPATKGDLAAVLPLKTEALKLRKDIEKRGDWLWRDAPFRDGAHFANSASVSNFFGDLAEFLEA
jgi:hypothetical protein